MLSRTLSLIILLSVVNGDANVHEEEKKSQFIMTDYSVAKAHGTANAEKWGNKNRFASTERYRKQHDNANVRKFNEKIQLASSENFEKRACSIDPKGPKLVILLSFGNSGSNEIWNLMGTFTGRNQHDNGFKRVERTLRLSPTNVIEEIDTEGAFSGGKEWLLNYMCKRQKANPYAYFVGFKWKPKKYSQKEKDVLEAIKLTNLPIKVVRLHRNVLDQLLSQNKIDIVKRLGLGVRCKKGIEPCAVVRKELGMKMHIQTSNLIPKLDKQIKMEFLFDRDLKKMEIPHTHVEFHKLLNEDDMQEWMQVLDFLGKPMLVTAGDRNKSMKLESISFSTNNLEKSISNYQEVRDTLRDSNLDFLLWYYD